jgi:hypothetical protein
MNFSQRKLWIFGIIIIAAILILTLIAAPANNKSNSGSTYGRGADGYGAWYAFMSKRGTQVQRWQKSFDDLADNKKFQKPITLLRIHSSSIAEILDSSEENWIEKGNRLVILGVSQPVTEADFNTIQNAGAQDVKIDTTRRKRSGEELLGDRHGAVVWQTKIGKGKVIFSSTPYLAANAYQDFPGNFEFLANLVTQNKQTIWVDECLHGYKDLEVIKQEVAEDIISYFSKTPLFPIFVQISILLIVTFLASLRRFGKPITVTKPIVENSQAYIDALAGVLQKAESTDFVVSAIAKEEQKNLQKALGLGDILLDRPALLNAWTQQTKRPTKELEDLLTQSSRKNSMNKSELLNWLKKWQEIEKIVIHSS